MLCFFGPIACAAWLNYVGSSKKRCCANKNQNAKNRAAWINGGPALPLLPFICAYTVTSRGKRPDLAKRGREARIKVLLGARQSPPRVKRKAARTTGERAQHKDSVTSHLHSPGRAHAHRQHTGRPRARAATESKCNQSQKCNIDSYAGRNAAKRKLCVWSGSTGRKILIKGACLGESRRRLVGRKKMGLFLQKRKNFPPRRSAMLRPGIWRQKRAFYATRSSVSESKRLEQRGGGGTAAMSGDCPPLPGSCLGKQTRHGPVHGKRRVPQEHYARILRLYPKRALAFFTHKLPVGSEMFLSLSHSAAVQ